MCFPIGRYGAPLDDDAMLFSPDRSLERKFSSWRDFDPSSAYLMVFIDIFCSKEIEMQRKRKYIYLLLVVPCTFVDNVLIWYCIGCIRLLLLC